MTAVMNAARPIAVDRRDAFLKEIADALASYSEVGPGVVHRICAEQQRRYFDPPNLGHTPGATSKYR
jgi:hypothetical protein